MHTLNGVYVTLLVLMVVYLLLTFNMYNGTISVFHELRIAVVNIFIYQQTFFLLFVTTVSKKRA